MTAPWDKGTGEERKDRALQHLEAARHAALTTIRTRLRELYRLRAKQGPLFAWVNADDAAAIYLEVRRRRPEMQDVPRCFLGATFKEKGWVWTGSFEQSKQPQNHARLLRSWRWEGAE